MSERRIYNTLDLLMSADDDDVDEVVAFIIEAIQDGRMLSAADVEKLSHTDLPVETPETQR